MKRQILLITAALIVGMAIGFGEFYLAATFIAAALLIIFVSTWINKIVRPRKQKRDMIIEIEASSVLQKQKILSDISGQGIRLEEKKIDLRDTRIIVALEATLQINKLKWLEDYLLSNEHVVAFSL